MLPSGKHSSPDMCDSALYWYRRAVEESGEGGMPALNCENIDGVTDLKLQRALRDSGAGMSLLTL